MASGHAPQPPKEPQSYQSHVAPTSVSSPRVSDSISTAGSSRDVVPNAKLDRPRTRIKFEDPENSSLAVSKDINPRPNSNDVPRFKRGRAPGRRRNICGNCEGKRNQKGQLYESSGHQVKDCSRPIDKDGFIDACPFCNEGSHNPNTCPALEFHKPSGAYVLLVRSRHGLPPIRCNWNLQSLAPARWVNSIYRPQRPAFALRYQLNSGDQELGSIVLDNFWEAQKRQWRGDLIWGNVFAVRPQALVKSPLDLCPEDEPSRQQARNPKANMALIPASQNNNNNPTGGQTGYLTQAELQTQNSSCSDSRAVNRRTSTEDRVENQTRNEPLNQVSQKDVTIPTGPRTMTKLADAVAGEGGNDNVTQHQNQSVFLPGVQQQSASAPNLPKADARQYLRSNLQNIQPAKTSNPKQPSQPFNLSSQNALSLKEKKARKKKVTPDVDLTQEQSQKGGPITEEAISRKQINARASPTPRHSTESNHDATPPIIDLTSSTSSKSSRKKSTKALKARVEAPSSIAPDSDEESIHEKSPSPPEKRKPKANSGRSRAKHVSQVLEPTPNPEPRIPKREDLEEELEDLEELIKLREKRQELRKRLRSFDDQGYRGESTQAKSRAIGQRDSIRPLTRRHRSPSVVSKESEPVKKPKSTRHRQKTPYPRDVPGSDSNETNDLVVKLEPV